MSQTIISHLLGLLLLMNLAACTCCSSGSAPNPTPTSARIADNKNDMAIPPAIARYMSAADHMTLQTLITTAQAQQEVLWRSPDTGARFEFTSLRIYVNEQGQGCRSYRLTLKRRLLGHRSFHYTACRNSQAVWQVTPS